jgi:hypothetical protein
MMALILPRWPAPPARRTRLGGSSIPGPRASRVLYGRLHAGMAGTLPTMLSEETRSP